jgi:hypothetical protein
MSLSVSPPMPAQVFYVVQSTGMLGRREHCLASVLYETRPQAHDELLRLTAVRPAAYSIWSGATYIEPPRWAHLVIRADGTAVPPDAGRRVPTPG